MWLVGTTVLYGWKDPFMYYQLRVCFMYIKVMYYKGPFYV